MKVSKLDLAGIIMGQYRLVLELTGLVRELSEIAEGRPDTPVSDRERSFEALRGRLDRIIKENGELLTIGERRGKAVSGGK